MLKSLVGSRLRARLLGWLFCHPEKRYFGRQIAKLVGEDPTNVARELSRLAEVGILTCEISGKQKFYQPDRKCPIFEELRGLAVKTVGLADVLANALESLKSRIEVAFVYGSLARGDQRADSDVDLVVVGNVTFGEVVSATGTAQDQLQREINPTVYPVEEFCEKVRSGHYFIRDVLENPKVFVIGGEDELERLVKGRSAAETSADPRGDSGSLEAGGA